MFGFFRRDLKLFAPVAGKTMNLSQVPDEVFAQKMAGDGLAIDSIGDVIVAPTDGEISLIFKTNHAFAMLLPNGVQLLVHIGIDTVSLNGEGFQRLVEPGTKVKAGTPVIKINRDSIINRGFSLITPLLITNVELIKDINVNTGSLVKEGSDIVLKYRIK